MAVGALDPGVPYESRWAPYDRIHGPGQGQFPEGSIRPRGYMAPDGRRSFAPPMEPHLSQTASVNADDGQPIATPPPMVRFRICVVFSMRSAAEFSALATAVCVALAR